MKIFRAIEKNEERSLLENKTITSPYRTLKNKNWILNFDKEVCDKSKFFFFTMEDALYFARKTYFAFNRTASIIETDIDENIILPYLAYGVYVYSDYNKNGEWDNFCEHKTPEILLPCELVEEKIKANHFRLIKIKKENFYKIDMPYDKDRPKSYVNMGKTLSGLISSKNRIVYNKKELEECNLDCHRQWLAEAQAEYKQYKTIFPNVLDKFIEAQQQYIWEDSIKCKEVIGNITNPRDTANEKE